MTAEPVPFRFDPPLTPAQIDALLADVAFAHDHGIGYGFVNSRHPEVARQSAAWLAECRAQGIDPMTLAASIVRSAPPVPARPAALPVDRPLTVAYFPGPDGRQVPAYVDAQPAPAPAERTGPAVSPLLVNALLGAGAFAMVSLGLFLLGSVIEALAHLVESLVILAAIVCGTPVAVQLLRALGGSGGQGHQTVINARRVRIGRITNRG